MLYLFLLYTIKVDVKTWLLSISYSSSFKIMQGFG